MESYEIKNEMDFVLHFLPVHTLKMLWYLLQMLMPKKVLHLGKIWVLMSFYMLLEYFLPWKFMKYMAPGDCIGQMSITEYFQAWILVKSSHANGFKQQDQQALDFFDAVNTQFKQAVTPGSFITCDQSMIK